MKKVIDLSILMTDFDGTPIKEQVEVGEGEEAKLEMHTITLKDALMGYIRRADKMGLSDTEQNVAYTLGFILAKAENSLELTTEQYNVIKKLADNGEMTLPNGTKQSIYGFILKNQTREGVDKAANVEE